MYILTPDRSLGRTARFGKTPNKSSRKTSRMVFRSEVFWTTMKILCFAAIGAVSTVKADMAGECDAASFYLELGCTPEPRADNSSSCPQAFTCPDLHPDKSMCYYRGVAYGANAMIPQERIQNPCSQRCTCQVRGGPRFECAAVDCVETFDSDLKDCVQTYELESCCSVGNVCGKDGIAKLKTCEVDGKTYREGEVFEPKGTMKNCICTAKWNGSPDPSYCRDVNCGIEIHYQDSILDNCAPMFFKAARGCPIAFKCPSEETKILRGLSSRGISSKCKFGNQTLAVGDEVTVEDKCTRCACEVPPFVTCTQQNTCS